MPPKGRTGPRRKYCTDECKRTANKPTAEAYERKKLVQRQKAAVLRAAISKVCPQCGDTFTPKKSRARIYCSNKCYRAGTKYSKSRTCSVQGCDSPVANRGMCLAHDRRAARADGREKPKIWDDKGRKNYQIRRERLGGAQNGDSAMLRALIQRGDRVCPECGVEIDLSLEYPNPMYRTIDHKIPLARGGKHELANCQLMHYQCNVAKGVRL